FNQFVHFLQSPSHSLSMMAAATPRRSPRLNTMPNLVTPSGGSFMFPSPRNRPASSSKFPFSALPPPSPKYTPPSAGAMISLTPPSSMAYPSLTPSGTRALSLATAAAAAASQQYLRRSPRIASVPLGHLLHSSAATLPAPPSSKPGLSQLHSSP